MYIFMFCYFTYEIILSKFFTQTRFLLSFVFKKSVAWALISKWLQIFVIKWLEILNHAHRPCSSTMLINHAHLPRSSTMLINHTHQSRSPTILINPSSSTILISHTHQLCSSTILINHAHRPCNVSQLCSLTILINHAPQEPTYRTYTGHVCCAKYRSIKRILPISYSFSLRSRHIPWIISSWNMHVMF